MLGCAFEQHVGRFAHELHDADHDYRRDDERDRGVDPRGSRREHDEAADGHRKGADRVAGDVKERGSNVEILPRAPQQRRPDSDIDDEPDAGDCRHYAALRHFWRGEAVDSFERDERGDRKEQHAVDERGQDLEARETVALAPGCRAPRLDRRRDRDGERDRVHEDVRCVREQREAMRDDAARDFEQCEPERARERRAQRCAFGRWMWARPTSPLTTAFAAL